MGKDWSVVSVPYGPEDKGHEKKTLFTGNEEEALTFYENYRQEYEATGGLLFLNSEGSVVYAC